MTAAVVFAAVFGAYLAGHVVGDYWVQTSAQALRKGLPGWAAAAAGDLFAALSAVQSDLSGTNHRPGGAR